MTDNQTHLFNTGRVTLNSGLISGFKIDCDALTDTDWKSLATAFTAGFGGAWGEAVGVPRGGLALARHLNAFNTTRAEAFTRGILSYVDVLVVDDVVTTGRSLRGLGAAYEAQGKSIALVAAFSRGRVPIEGKPIIAMFTMGGWMNLLPPPEDEK